MINDSKNAPNNVPFAQAHAFVELVEAPRMIRVLAPSDLPRGYELQVETKDAATFLVTVPVDGVQAGEIFLVPMPEGYKMEQLINVPTGHWKDGLFDFFKYGACHSHLWCALCCSQIAMGQLMQRMRLSWIGNRTVADRAMSTFRTVLIMTVCYMIFDYSLSTFISLNMENGYYADINPAIPVIRNIGGFMFTVWSVYALYKTRQNVRREFSIPEERCIGCEDCMCAAFCGCCTGKFFHRHMYYNYLLVVNFGRLTFWLLLLLSFAKSGANCSSHRRL